MVLAFFRDLLNTSTFTCLRLFPGLMVDIHLGLIWNCNNQ